MRHRVVSLLLLLLIPMVAARAQKRAFTAKDLYRIKSISSISVSPDGKSVPTPSQPLDLPARESVTHLDYGRGRA